MEVQKHQALIAAAVACFLAAAGTVSMVSSARAEGAECYGVNACKGTGECGGKGHSCAGKNECAGQGWLKIEKDTCLKIKGGRLTADVQPKQ